VIRLSSKLATISTSTLRIDATLSAPMRRAHALDMAEHHELDAIKKWGLQPTAS
jgi:hypothetical protein